MNDYDPNINNGLMTKIWGPPTWEALHAFTYGYPVNPTNEQKQNYRNFFISVGNVLPCKYCRESYQKFISQGETSLNESDLESRYTLRAWLFRIHNKVNNKLGVDYGITLEDLDKKFESCRSKCGTQDVNAQYKGCITPLYHKANSFKRFYHKDCPIIPKEIIEPFIRLARERGIEDKHFLFIINYDKLCKENDNMKETEIWYCRNKICDKIIKQMREEGLSSIETEGPWKGTPTIPELLLILYLSSNLNRTELNECLKFI